MWASLAKNLLRSKVQFSVAYTSLKAQRNKHFPCRSLLYFSRWQHTAPVYEQSCLTEAMIRNVEILDAQRFVCVHWEDGGQSLYPYVWLRDNCQCPQCFLHSAKARKLPIENLDVNTGLRNLNLTDTNKVSITWPDDHQSEFDAQWLKKRCFSKESRAEMQEELFLQEHQYWGSDLKMPTMSYEDVLSCDQTALQWLCTLREVGIVLLEGAPVKQGELVRLGRRIGYMRHTFYGSSQYLQTVFGRTGQGGHSRRHLGELSPDLLWMLLAPIRLSLHVIPDRLDDDEIEGAISSLPGLLLQGAKNIPGSKDCQGGIFSSGSEYTWQVQDKTDANNVAYTSGKLSLHTDYPALQYPPGVQFLHCLKQAESGGESEVVDGFHVCNKLRKQNPEAYNILTSTQIDFTDTGVDYCDFSLQSKQRIIELDPTDELLRINFNNATRDSVLNIPPQKVQPFYSALKEFVDLMNQPENTFYYKMRPGQVVTFDNWRILHGRKSYESGGEVSRHLEGSYLDWDVVMSRLRALKRKLQNSS